MEAGFWQSRWQENQIGFHKDCVNQNILQHFPKLGLKKGQRVLVPLCGKSLDMLWLREQGLDVLGVELCSIAIEAFAKEQNIEFETMEEGPFTRYKSPGLEILCGDFMNLSLEHLGNIDGVYDRASIIALPQPMRIQYAEQMARICPKDTKYLLLAFEYDQDLIDGPPFSVSSVEVSKLFGDVFDIEILQETELSSGIDKFKEAGVDQVRECVYQLCRH